MDDQARQVLDRLAALAPDGDPAADDAAWLAAFRYQTALLRDFGGVSEPLLSVGLRSLGGVGARIFRPSDDDDAILFHLHGGGGIAGTLDGHDPALRLLAARTGWTVVAPDYRLAPEHRFPAQLEDSYSALIALHAERPARRIVLSGDSIGATLATALAMLVRDRGGPALAGQLLLYPNTDLRRGADYPSRRSEDGNIIGLEDLERQIDLYVADDAARSDARASPLLSDQLDTLPPTLILTCERDPLRDEGEAYARRLRAAGVTVEHHRVPGMIHAFLQMAGMVSATTQWLAVAKRWLGDR
ncbi:MULTISPECIES: alpha/beta hydrolase [unclassified Sphingomonas]|uniref:alpha/beta hydrolase n=1 Tax=unclassified Sphingomonas TaxID=196159 RepID=UPI001F5AE526|nr:MULTISPECIES: alpha/beta hydrolase [unclassified Sphingomonas]